jgi:hypothetical protein
MTLTINSINQLVVVMETVFPAVLELDSHVLFRQNSGFGRLTTDSALPYLGNPRDTAAWSGYESSVLRKPIGRCKCLSHGSVLTRLGGNFKMLLIPLIYSEPFSLHQV